MFVSVSNVYGQVFTVSGTITDDAGETLPGVSVNVKGTTQGVVADVNGRYSINIQNEEAVLIFSFIGFANQEIAVGDRRIIDVKMSEAANELEEVVIVGYGTQRLKDMTGSAVAVKMDELLQLPGTSILDALAGQVVGLHVETSDGRPGSVGRLRVREPLTYGTGQDAFRHPLIVIDDVIQLDENGEPSMAAFNRLDFSEIESMTVLKDASAAIYGTRASSGVILVKTKRGEQGKTKIDYSLKLDYADAVSHVKVMNANDLGVFTNRMIRQMYDNDPSNNLLRYRYSEYELREMKKLNHDWLGEAWQPALSQRHSLTVTGGQDRVSYFAGINYQDQTPNLGKVQDYDRWTYRAGGEINVVSGLKLSASISGYNATRVQANNQARPTDGPWGSQISQENADYAPLRHMPKYIPMTVELYDPAMDEMRDYYVSSWNGPHASNGIWNDTGLGTGIAAWNFFANEASKARNVNNSNGYTANFSLTYEVPFIRGLSLKAIYASSNDNSDSNELGDYYLLARPSNTVESGLHLISDETQWLLINFGDPYSEEISRKPTVRYSKTNRKTQQINLIASYSRRFGNHDISMTGIIERGETEGSTLETFYRGIGMSYMGTSAQAGVLQEDRTSFTKTESGSLSYAGRFNYKYDNRYLFEFLIRTDASTKFAPENYWGTFPSGSVGWVLSEEGFFKNSGIANVINFLKFRYSLGKTGKDNAKAWMWKPMYDVSPTSGMGFGSQGGQAVMGANVSGTFNRAITWDSSVKQNYGVDFNFLANRLAFTTEYWLDNTYDIIMKVPENGSPIYIGKPMPETNYGKKKGWGWEFSLRWSDRIQQSLLPKWGSIRYGIGVDYGISWTENTLGMPFVFDYPADMLGSSSASSRTGWKGPGHEYGFKTWKQTSQGDGILRTQDDIDSYWNYLTELADAAGGNPEYLGITNKSLMRLGMLAYQDIAGSLDQENQTIGGPNGVISRDHGQDEAVLVSKMRHSIPCRINLSWGNFNFSTHISTAWGGIALIDQDTRQEVGGSRNPMIWSQFAFVNDMFDPVENPNGKYPSMAVAQGFGVTSDFWMVSSFRMYVRNMTFGYSLPKELLERTGIGIDKLQISVTGNNLWDFYNPYPDKYRNMYDRGRSGYPTLRTWTLSLNVSF